MTDSRVFLPQQPIISPSQKFVPAVQNDKSVSTGGPSFQQILQQQTSNLKFSQHAVARLQSRNIKLSKNQLFQLDNAVNKAAQKGSNESLILMDNNLALVVSIKNRTVITAVDGASMKESVFTNIDSAVIV